MVKRPPGFKPLVLSHFLGLFNDNILWLIISVGVAGAEPWRPLSGTAFILPVFLFFATAGLLADRYNKRTIIISSKLMELVVVILGGVALYYRSFAWNSGVSLSILFAIGIKNTLFYPSCYGMLPEIFREPELSYANGVMQSWMFMGIILGSSAGGFLLLSSSHDIKAAVYLSVGIAAMGFFSSLFVEKVEPAGTARGVNREFFRDFKSGLSAIRSSKPLFAAVMAIMLFWFTGVFLLMAVVTNSRELLIGQAASNLLLAILAFGAGAGSLLAGRHLSGRMNTFHLPPVPAAIVLLLSILMINVRHSILLPVTLLVMGGALGFLLVPLNVYVQLKSPKESRGQVLAIVNLLLFTGMIVALVLFSLLPGPAGLNE